MRGLHSPFLLKVTPGKYIFLPLLALGLIYPYPVRAALSPYPVSGAFSLPGAFLPVPSASYAPRYRPGEVLIRFKAGTSPALITSLSQRYALRQVSSSPYSGFHRVATATVAGDLVQALRKEPGVVLAEANFIRHVDELVPNDPLFSLQWHLHANGLPLAWDLSTGQNVVVAVLDTGIAYENYLKFAQAPDLANTSFLPGWDFVNNDANPDDDNRHGTHIAGIIAQSTNNLTGGAGVAFQCSLMPVKVLDASGAGDVATIVDGVYYAVNNGAQIINMSYGSIVDPSATEEEAINYAVSQGVLVICSAGNEASNQPHYPSSYPNSLSITATRFDNSFASSYSNYGPDVDLAAPGGDLSLDQDGDGNPDGIYQQTHDGRNFRRFDFYYAEGTSSACAYASGVAALVLARGGGLLSAAQVREIMESTAIDLDTPGWDQYYGWGVLNPYAALLAVDAAIIAPVAAAQGRLWPFSIPMYPVSGLHLTSPAGGISQAISSLRSAALVNSWIDNLIGVYNPLSPLIGSSTARETRISASSQDFLLASSARSGLSSGDSAQVLFNPFAVSGIPDYLFSDLILSPGGYSPLAPAAGFSSSWTGIPVIPAGGSRMIDTISAPGHLPLIASYYGLLWPIAANIPSGKVLFAP